MPADVVEALLDLVGALRRAGVPVSPDRVPPLLSALDALHGRDLYWAGRLTLCATPAHVAIYDRVFAEYVTGDRPRGGDADQPSTPHRADRVAVPFGAPGGEAQESDGEPVAAYASAAEVLRHRDLATVTASERAETARLIALLRPVAPVRPGRRRRPSPARGGVDVRRSVRAMLRAGGEPVRLARTRPHVRPRRLVLLIDVSGSMSPYADALLRLAHAAVRNRPRATEVFAFGTRLTRITPALRQRQVDAALREAGAAIPDWRGGTRLGEALHMFLRTYGHRGTARGAVVVVFSDGWERGDPGRLAAATQWLSRLAHALIWVSPHAARPGFAPLAAGLAAVAPHVNALVGGHSVAALEELVEVLRDA